MNVEDAMLRDRSRLVSNRVPVREALQAADRIGEDALLVEIRYGNWGWVSRRDLERAIDEGLGEDTVQEALRTRSVIRTHPDLPLDQAMRKLAVYPLLPVASRVNPSFLVGTLTLEDVHRSYGIAREDRSSRTTSETRRTTDHS